MLSKVLRGLIPSAAVVIFMLTATVFAAAPNLVNYQGRLTDGSGSPVADGPYSVTFAIYSAPSGGSALWNETQSVTASGGLFSALLGSSTPFDPSVFADSSRYLGIKVGADPEMSPRTRLSSVPYALSSASADGWQDDGTTVRLSTTSDRVGIGTSSALSKLEIVGKGTNGKSLNANDVLMVIPDSPFVGINRDFKVIPQEVFGVHSPKPGYGGMFVSTPSPSDFPFYGYSGGGNLNTYHYVDPTSKSWHLWNNYSDRVVLDSSGNLGVGNTSPSAKIDATSADDYGVAVQGLSTGNNGVAVQGLSTGNTNSIGGAFSGRSTGLQAIADNNAVSPKYGIYSQARGTGGLKYGVYAYASGDNPNYAYGIFGEADGQNSTAGNFIASGNYANGVVGKASGGTITNLGVSGYANGTGENYGVYGSADAGVKNYAIYGVASSSTGHYAGYFSKGSPGIVGSLSSPVAVFQNSTNAYININSPDANERGVLFGQPSQEAAGGIVYHTPAVPNGFSFRTQNNTTRMVITGTGRVGIGTTAPAWELQVNGSICYTVAIGACSDVRYKKDVFPLSNSLDRLMQLRGITYRWKADEYPDQGFDDRTHLGFIAQEVEKLYPEMVMTDKDGYKSVDYGRLTPVLVEAIREQQKTIEALTARLEKLEVLVSKMAGPANSSGADTYGIK